MDTGDRLPLADIIYCLHSLETDIGQQIARRGGSLSTNRIYNHSAVRVAFTPLKMTWKIAGKVVSALIAITNDDHWTYASHVTVSDVYDGRVGDLSIAYRPPREASASLQSTSDNGSLTTGAQQNGTLIERPESPHSHDIPGSHISLLCVGYGTTLNSGSVFALLLGAQIFMRRMVVLHGPLATVSYLAPFKLENVVLEVRPSNRLRWADLLIAVEGVADFVATWDTFAFTFDIRWQGVRSLGVGQLRPKS